MRLRSLLFSIVFLSCFTLTLHSEENPDTLLAEGKAELSASQDDPKAVVNAARFFLKASELYEKAGKTDEAVEVNSYLYWCKKKMTRDDMDAFLKDKSTNAATLEKVGNEKVAISDAQRWYDRAEKFAT